MYVCIYIYICVYIYIYIYIYINLKTDRRLQRLRWKRTSSVLGRPSRRGLETGIYILM